MEWVKTIKQAILTKTKGKKILIAQKPGQTAVLFNLGISKTIEKSGGGNN